jgi:hypothetical protein
MVITLFQIGMGALLLLTSTHTLDAGSNPSPYFSGSDFTAQPTTVMELKSVVRGGVYMKQDNMRWLQNQGTFTFVKEIKISVAIYVLFAAHLDHYTCCTCMYGVMIVSVWCRSEWAQTQVSNSLPQTLYLIISYLKPFTWSYHISNLYSKMLQVE